MGRAGSPRLGWCWGCSLMQQASAWRLQATTCSAAAGTQCNPRCAAAGPRLRAGMPGGLPARPLTCPAGRCAAALCRRKRWMRPTPEGARRSKRIRGEAGGCPARSQPAALAGPALPPALFFELTFTGTCLALPIVLCPASTCRRCCADGEGAEVGVAGGGGDGGGAVASRSDAGAGVPGVASTAHPSRAASEDVSEAVGKRSLSGACPCTMGVSAHTDRRAELEGPQPAAGWGPGQLAHCAHWPALCCPRCRLMPTCDRVACCGALLPASPLLCAVSPIGYVVKRELTPEQVEEQLREVQVCV